VASLPNAYSRWMRTLSTLSQADSRAPRYMRTAAWQSCRMNTALAGWTQLRHTYLLSAAETYAEYAGISELPGGMVEPNPSFFHVLADLAAETEKKSAARMEGGEVALLHEFVRECR